MARREKPRMTKAHYELLAAALKRVYDNGSFDMVSEHAFTCRRVSDALVGTNPLFDKDKFLAACGVS